MRRKRIEAKLNKLCGEVELLQGKLIPLTPDSDKWLRVQQAVAGAKDYLLTAIREAESDA